MQSILDINEKGTFSPVPHRIKDVPDFIVDSRTLLDQVKNPIKRMRGMNELQDISNYFGTGNVREMTANPTKEFILTKPESINWILFLVVASHPDNVDIFLMLLM